MAKLHVNTLSSAAVVSVVCRVNLLTVETLRRLSIFTFGLQVPSDFLITVAQGANNRSVVLHSKHYYETENTTSPTVNQILQKMTIVQARLKLQTIEILYCVVTVVTICTTESWLSGRTSVSGQRFFAVLRSTCS